MFLPKTLFATMTFIASKEINQEYNELQEPMKFKEAPGWQEKDPEFH